MIDSSSFTHSVSSPELYLNLSQCDALTMLLHGFYKNIMPGPIRPFLRCDPKHQAPPIWESLSSVCYFPHVFICLCNTFLGKGNAERYRAPVGVMIYCFNSLFITGSHNITCNDSACVSEEHTV